MSASHLLLSYSRNVLRPLAEKSNDKDTIFAKIKRYEGKSRNRCPCPLLLLNLKTCIRSCKQPTGLYIWKEPYKSKLYCRRTIKLSTLPSFCTCQWIFVSERCVEKSFGFKCCTRNIWRYSNSLQYVIECKRVTCLYLLLHVSLAMVGGPSKNDSFTDVRLDWSQTEVALDYNAPYQNVLAYQVMFNPNGPFYYDPEAAPFIPDEDKRKNSALPAWAIVLAVIFPVLFIAGLIYLFFRRRRNAIEKKDIKFGKNKCE